VNLKSTPSTREKDQISKEDTILRCFHNPAIKNQMNQNTGIIFLLLLLYSICSMRLRIVTWGRMDLPSPCPVTSSWLILRLERFQKTSIPNLATCVSGECLMILATLYPNETRTWQNSNRSIFPNHHHHAEFP